MIEFFIAKRHILDRKFQSIVSIIGISIALSVFIVSLAISNGLKNNMLNSILSLSPHITVNIYEDNLSEYENILNKLKEYEFKNINPRIESQSLINVNGINKASILLGTNLEKLDLKIIEGEKDSNNLTGVLVGVEFLNQTGTNIGDKINIINSETKEITAEIVGIFKTGFYNYDSDLVIIPLKTMQILQDKGEVANKISILLDDPININKLNKITEEINLELGDFVYAHNWSEDNQNLLSAINFEKFVLIAILSLIIIIASFAVSVILNMVVREKINDIGILKAVGYKNANILKIFLLEGIIIGIIGIILSAILSPIILIFLKLSFKYFITSTYYIESLPSSISILEIFIIYILSFILIILSSILPAYKASKMKPTDAIKYNS